MRRRVTSGALRIRHRPTETLRLAFRLGDHLLAVGLRLLTIFDRVAARFGNDLVGVGFGCVAHALLVGARRLHVAIGVR
jgi:hypothetical protein